MIRRAPGLAKDQIIIINLSGRGDKDLAALGLWEPER